MRERIAGKLHSFRAMLEFLRFLKNWREVWTKYRLNQALPPLELRGGPTIFHDGELDDVVLLFRELIVANCYQPRGFFRPRPGDVVLDIGANIGFFALSLQRGRGGIRVHSFEPVSSTRGRLMQNVEKNGLGGLITCHPEAVSRERGTLKLLKYANSAHSSAFPKQSLGYDDLEEVPTITLDEAASRVGRGLIDLLKVDIEGGEIEALEAADDATWRRISRVIVEYHDLIRPGCRGHVVDLLGRKGFADIAVVPENSTPGLGLILARRES